MTIRGLRRFGDATPASRVFACAVVGIIAAGTLFRISGALTTPLWNDEARQAVALGGDIDIADLATWPLNLRPVLYLLVGKLSIGIHDVEWMLRLTSLVPSIAALLVTFALARLLFASRASVVFCVFCIALNPWLIDFAKEYKPYALEHFLVTLQCYLVFRWLRRGGGLCALLVIAAIAPLLGFACIFVEPVVLAVLAVAAWRDGDRRTLAVIAATAAVTLALFATQYALFQQHATRMGFRYWNENFYDSDFHVRRFAGHLHDIAGRFAAGPSWWSALSPVLAAVNAALFAIGIAVIAIRRRWQLLAIIVGPLVLPLVASVAGRWPYGMVRVNLYLIGLVVLAWSAALDFALASQRLRRAGLATAAALVALQLPLEPRQLLDKQIPAGHMRPVLRAMDMPGLLDRIFAAEADRLPAGAKLCVHVSAEARPVFTYYTRQRDGSAAVSARLHPGRMLSYNTRYTMLEMAAAIRGDAQPCWLIRSYMYDEQLAYHRVVRDNGVRTLDEIEAPGLLATRIERVRPAIAAAGDGSIALRAEDAVLHGDGLWFYGRAQIGGVQGIDRRWASEAIGNWTSVDDAPSWSFDVARASEYDVLIRQAEADGPGSDYVVAVGDQELRGTVPRTTGWRDFVTTRLGMVTLAPGLHSVWVRATAKRGAYVMNLRGLTLVPRAPDSIEGHR